MNNLLLYLIQSQLSLLVLFSLYMLLLRKQTNFKFNRIFLIVSVIASVLLPLFDFSFIYANPNYYILLPAYEMGASNMASGSSLTINTGHIIIFIYALISSMILGKFLWDLLSIIKIKRLSSMNTIEKEGLKININRIQNFSFFNWIFIRESDQNNLSIIEHERAHARMLHSLDIIIIKVFQSVFWINPLGFLIEKELRLQHEYEVDQMVLRNHNSLIDYQQMLLNQVFQTEFNLVTNNFNQSFLKNRFAMMTKKENTKSRPLLLAALFTVSILTPILFSCSMESKQENQTLAPIEENQKTQEVVLEKVTETDDLFTVVEEMPKFPGGDQAMYEYIGKNLEYPAKAKEENIQGRVVVEFVVEKDGKITHAKVIQGIGYGCDEAAKEIIAGMPNWSPGKQRGKEVRVKFALPLNFKLQ